MNKNSVPNKLELHYYFNDDTHTMDAVVRNKCEHELLQIVGEISKDLGIHIKIETEAFDEGGLKEFYSFVGSTKGQAILGVSNIVISILAMVLSRIPLKKSKLDKTEQKLSIKEKKLNIKAQELNIALLEAELVSKGINNPNISKDKIESLISENIKIKKHKSNYYKNLKNYSKVDSISTVSIDSEKKYIGEPLVTSRKDFSSFILESDNLDSINDDSAVIEIISPVLKKGKFKWRGIYNKTSNSIEFAMKDKDFKNDVISNKTSIINGTFIDCVLEIGQKINELGEVFNSSYTVLTVLKQHTDGVSTETIQGKKYRQKKEADDSQYKMF